MQSEVKKRGDGIMLKHKKLTSKNGITIPKDLREDVGLDAGMAVDIESRNGEIVIKKHTPICKFCKSIQGVKNIMGIEICPECARKLLKAVEEKYGA